MFTTHRPVGTGPSISFYAAIGLLAKADPAVLARQVRDVLTAPETTEWLRRNNLGLLLTTEGDSLGGTINGYIHPGLNGIPPNPDALSGLNGNLRAWWTQLDFPIRETTYGRDFGDNDDEGGLIVEFGLTDAQAQRPDPDSDPQGVEELMAAVRAFGASHKPGLDCEIYALDARRMVLGFPGGQRAAAVEETCITLQITGLTFDELGDLLAAVANQFNRDSWLWVRDGEMITIFAPTPPTS